MRRTHDDLEAARPNKRATHAAAVATERADDADGERSPAQVVELLQRSAGNAAVQQWISTGDTPVAGVASGEPVPPTIRAAAERRLRSDLGDVRVHTDADAGAYAATLGAEAVTVGRNVFFRDGEPDVSTPRGQKTYVHEMTHAAQAQEGGPNMVAKRVSRPGSAVEREAADIAAGGLTGPATSVSQTATAGVAHRQVATEEELDEGEAEVTNVDKVAGPELAPAEANKGQPDAPSPLRALFRVAVDQRLIAAHGALSAARPQPLIAVQELKAARESVKALAGSYRGTDPLLHANLRALGNGITSVLVALGPLVGAKGTDIETIAAHTMMLLNSAAEVGSSLK